MNNAAAAASKTGSVVFRGGAVGDFIVTLPLLGSLRRAYPDERVTLVAHPAHSELAIAAGLADDAHSIESAELAPFFARESELPAEWSDRFGGAARLISFLHDPDGTFAANAKRAGASSWIAGPHRPRDGSGVAARQLVEPIERALGLPVSDPSAFRLQLNRSAEEEAAKIVQGSPWIAIHPGSGGAQKNWPVERWIELARLLLRQRSDLRLVLIGGEVDAIPLASMQRALAPKRVLVVEHAPLSRVAALIARCESYLGHDSGITHLAATTAVRSVALFGPSDPAVWAPPQLNTRIVRAPNGDLRLLDIAEVLNCLSEVS